MNRSSEDVLILKKIDGKSATANGYVSYNNSLYIVANTFDDSFGFLGAYFLRYDCKSATTERIAGPLKSSERNELGYISYIESRESIALELRGDSGKGDRVWIYDLRGQTLRFIDYDTISTLRGKKVFIKPLYPTYDGVSIELEVLYLSAKYSDDPSERPDRIRYYF